MTYDGCCSNDTMLVTEQARHVSWHSLYSQDRMFTTWQSWQVSWHSLFPWQNVHYKTGLLCLGTNILGKPFFNVMTKGFQKHNPLTQAATQSGLGQLAGRYFLVIAFALKPDTKCFQSAPDRSWRVERREKSCLRGDNSTRCTIIISPAFKSPTFICMQCCQEVCALCFIFQLSLIKLITTCT